MEEGKLAMDGIHMKNRRLGFGLILILYKSVLKKISFHITRKTI